MESKSAQKFETIRNNVVKLEEQIKLPNHSLGTNAKGPKENSMAEIAKHLPELILKSNDFRITNCYKTLKDVSNMAPAENMALNNPKSIEMLPTLITIQNYLKLKAIDYQYWGEFAYSCCDSLTMKKIRNNLPNRGQYVTWEDIIFIFFRFSDFERFEMDRLNAFLSIQIPNQVKFVSS